MDWKEETCVGDTGHIDFQSDRSSLINWQEAFIKLQHDAVE